MLIISKYQGFSLRLLLSIYLIFFQFQPGVAYKSGSYKKVVCITYEKRKSQLVQMRTLQKQSERKRLSLL